MPIENKALLLDLVSWIAEQPRAYADVMDAWRTSCPRLPVWEDAVDHGFVVCKPGGVVTVAPAGRAFLADQASGTTSDLRSPTSPRP